MARQKNMIPRFVTFDMEELAMIQSRMTHNEIADFWENAVRDLRSGCSGEKVNPFIKRQFKIAQSRMNIKQSIDSKYYKNKRGRKPTEKPSQEQEKPIEAPELKLDVAVTKPEKHGYGPNKLVMLTEEEGSNLRQLYGADLELAIEILDGYLLQGSKAAKAYKSHAAVLRRGNWVWKKVQETKTTEIRKQTAEQNQKNAQNRDGRSFRERDMDARGAEARMLMELQNG